MKSTRPLIDKIKQNAIEAIEINGQIISGSESFPDLNKHNNSVRYATYIGNNKALTIGKENYNYTKCELMTIDLSTKKVKTQSFDLPPNSYLSDFVVLDNPDSKYIALSVSTFGGYSKLLILNTHTMKIEESFSENIGQCADRNSYGYGITLHKYNGQLYGITGESMGPTFFTAPATFNASFKLTNKIKMHKDVTGGDVAIDRYGSAFFPYQKYLWSLSCLRDGAEASPMLGNRSSVGTRMLLMQQSTGPSYLMYNQDPGGNEVHVFQGGEDAKYGIDPRLQEVLRFSKERIYKVVPLANQEKSKLILVSTEKASYIYDLINNMIVGKIQNLAHNRHNGYVHAVTDGVLFDPMFGDHSSDTKMMLLTVCQMQQSNELKLLLNALKNNTSVKEVFINDMVIDAEILQILYDLRKKTDLKLIISNELQSMLDLLKTQQAKDVASQVKITTMNETQQAQQTIIAQLRSAITDLEQKKQSESKQFSVEREALQLKLTEQTAQSSAAIDTMEHKLNEQQQAFFAKEQALVESEAALKEAYQKDIIAVQKEMQATSQSYEELFTQLSVSSLPVQSLAKQIYQTDQLDERLCQELIDPKHNIKGLSLIRWAEQDELKHVKEDLEQRGAIFHVDDLVKKIKQIEPPYNDKQTLKSFTKAIEKLELDYKNNVLPQSEVQAMVALITPDIQKDIDTYPWLQELYFPETEVIKNNLVEKFFTSEAKVETIFAVESEFLRAVEEILKNTKYKHHHARLKDDNLLSSIRTSENKSDPLVSLLKTKMDISNINLSPEQEALALQAVLEKPTQELNKLIEVKIIQYWEKMKELVNPKLVKIQQLENKIKALEQKAGVTHVVGTMFNGKKENNKVAHPVLLSRSLSWS